MTHATCGNARASKPAARRPTRSRVRPMRGRQLARRRALAGEQDARHLAGSIRARPPPPRGSRPVPGPSGGRRRWPGTRARGGRPRGRRSAAGGAGPSSVPGPAAGRTTRSRARRPADGRPPAAARGPSAPAGATRSATGRVGDGALVDAVPVDACRGREPGVEPRRGVGGVADDDLGPEHRVQRQRDPLRPLRRGARERDHLPSRVHAGIRAARHRQHGALPRHQASASVSRPSTVLTAGSRCAAHPRNSVPS